MIIHVKTAAWTLYFMTKCDSIKYKTKQDEENISHENSTDSVENPNWHKLPDFIGFQWRINTFILCK